MKNFFLYLNKFILVSRYNKPHGIFLLFYPCIWGLSISNKNILEVYYFYIIFFIGSCGMRSLGCIWNDWNDRKLDIFVTRTKGRLLASGKVSNYEIIIFSTINLILGVFPLFFIGKFSIILCFVVLPLIISYPFMKRITWWPQFWLGLNFNWGLLVSFYAVSEIKFNISILLFYIGSIFWTIAYDTIYGFQDIKDDLKIGIKSTSIKFSRSPKFFLILNYLACSIFWHMSLYTTKIKPLMLLFLTIIFIPLILNTMKINLNDPLSCEKSFKYNSFFGFFTSILLVSFSILLK